MSARPLASVFCRQEGQPTRPGPNLWRIECACGFTTGDRARLEIAATEFDEHLFGGAWDADEHLRYATGGAI